MPVKLQQVTRNYRLRNHFGMRVTSLTCFDAIFDCIVNMTGRLFNMHIVKTTPNNQTRKRGGFLIFILTLTSHFTFS